jgi:hypothetical protein
LEEKVDPELVPPLEPNPGPCCWENPPKVGVAENMKILDYVDAYRN